MIELVIVIIIILFLLYMIRSNSLYMNLHQTELSDIIQKYQSLPFLNTVRTVIVIEPDNLEYKTLELCIKSIFNQDYRINNLYIITNTKDDIPEYIKDTSVVVPSFHDVKLLESEETTQIVKLQNIGILDSKEFIQLCRNT
jgi:hypothetical protein